MRERENELEFFQFVAKDKKQELKNYREQFDNSEDFKVDETIKVIRLNTKRKPKFKPNKLINNEGIDVLK